jgi:hypothetical protein
MVEITHTARAVRFTPCHRIVASRLPTIHLFERVADPADWDALYELESRTNPRIRTQLGELHLVPVADRVSGPNASIVMAPFTHLSPPGTRFTDGHFGAYYAADRLTAIAETRFHREEFPAPTVSRPSSSKCAVISRMSPANCTTCAGGAWNCPTSTIRRVIPLRRS